MVLKNNVYYISIMILLPIIFLLIFGRFGLEDADSGFIVGMGWRIFNGEIPYRDFYYVRPIISPLISYIFLNIFPDYAQILLMRLVNYYQLMIQVFLTVFSLSKYYNFNLLKLNIYIFSILCFLITSIGTLYFQWHTTDGIFFAVIGFFLISYFKNKNFFIFILTGIFFGISALTKQNFLVVPILGFLFVFLQYGIKNSLLILCGVFIPFLIFYFYLVDNNIFNIFLIQNKGSTTFNDLFYSGFLSYFIGFGKIFKYALISLLLFFLMKFIFNKNKIIFLLLSICLVVFFVYLVLSKPINESFFVKVLPVSIIFLFLFFNKKINLNNYKSIFLAVFSAIVFLNSIVFLIIDGSPQLILFDKFLSALIFLAFLYLLFSGKEGIRDHYFLIALLGVSWGSSISWGAMSPLMFFTPIVFLLYFLLHNYLNIFNIKINIYIFILIIPYVVLVNSKPYRDDFIWSNDYVDASEISPKLAFIKSSNIKKDKHLELEIILNKYNKTTILPSMPGAYYIHNKINYFSIDWPMDVEAAYDRKGLIRDLESCCNYYIVEKKSFGQPIGKEGKFYSSITDYVLSNFRLYDSSYEFFDIYVK